MEAAIAEFLMNGAAPGGAALTVPADLPVGWIGLWKGRDNMWKTITPSEMKRIETAAMERGLCTGEA
ncbi:MAG: hypothetical protein IJ041_02140, partial [Clostridia bacterium]|nr:hypothetical protein [Clostridia bacterium]